MASRMTLLAAFLRSVRILKQIGINVRLEKKENWSFFNKYLLIFLNSWYNKYTFDCIIDSIKVLYKKNYFFGCKECVIKDNNIIYNLSKEVKKCIKKIILIFLFQ